MTFLPVALAIAAAPAHAARAHEACVEVARRLEQSQGIPPGLVEAVALAESGRWVDELRGARPWPWTVTAGADSFFLPSKEAALRKVHELRSAGRTNIDVGCMQVNLGWHGEAFSSLEEAFDPAANVAYGARFLKDLRLRTRSWARATARYHSSDPERGEAYRTKVYRLWQKLRRQLVEGRDGTSASLVRRGGAAPVRPEEAPSSSGRRVLSPAFDLPQRAGGIAIVRGR